MKPKYKIHNLQQTGGYFMDLEKVIPIIHGRWLTLGYVPDGLGWYGRVRDAILLQISLDSRNGKTTLAVQLSKAVRDCCNLPKHSEVNKILKKMKQHGLVDLDTTTKPYTIYVLIDLDDCHVMSDTKPSATPYPVFEPGERVFVSDKCGPPWTGTVESQSGEHCYVVWDKNDERYHILARFVYPLKVAQDVPLKPQATQLTDDSQLYAVHDDEYLEPRCDESQDDEETPF